MRHHFGLGLICAATLAATGSARAEMTPTVTIREQPQRSTCDLELIMTAGVKSAIDGTTLALQDGREVRLAGIEAPVAPALAATTKATVDRLVTGRNVTLKRLGPEHDRHGRLWAYALVNGDEPSVQRVLLTAGQARVAAWVGDASCAAELQRAERIAREARLGLWADLHYVIRGTDQPAAILADRGRLTLVEGQVLSVRESGGVIYLNFGRRWSEDFTVTVPKRIEKVFTAAGLELKKLSGRRVRVRGVIEERGGPWIEAVRPEQIEVLDVVDVKRN